MGGCFLGATMGGGKRLMIFFMRGSVLDSHETEPSLTHLLQTSILAPSIIALYGVPMIFRPHTSHRKVFFLSEQLFYSIVYLILC
jgi:hypothetical protein